MSMTTRTGDKRLLGLCRFLFRCYSNPKQCVFYDILLGRKSYNDILRSSDILTAMGPGSVALSQRFIYNDGSSGIITCETAYNFIRNGWNSYYTTAAPKIAAQFRSEEHTSEIQSLM